MKTRAEQRQIPPDREGFSLSDLNNLPELNPPDLMPNGNVGTPTLVFMDFIKQCRLPPKIIKKLGLSFPKTRTSKQYGSVPFDYGGEVTSAENKQSDSEEVLTRSGHEIVPENNCESKGCDRQNSVLGPNSSSTSQETNRRTSVDSINHKSDNSGKKRRKKKETWRDEEARERMKLNIEENMMGQSDESEHVRFSRCLFIQYKVNFLVV